MNQHTQKKYLDVGGMNLFLLSKMVHECQIKNYKMAEELYVKKFSNISKMHMAKQMGTACGAS